VPEVLEKARTSDAFLMLPTLWLARYWLKI